MADLSSILAQIRQNESGGNYTAQNPTSTASGAYQFVNGTWQQLTTQSGIGTQYQTAGSAPPNIQDAVAAYALQQNPNPNSSSLWQNANYTYPQVTNYDVSSYQLANSPGGLGGVGSGYSLASNQTPETGLGGSTIYGGGSGTPEDPYSFETTVTPNTATSIPQLSGTSSGYADTAPSTASETAGASTPGVLLDEPYSVGLTPGLASGISGWISGAEGWFGKMWDDTFGALIAGTENMFIRGFLILVGIAILIVALWRLAAPDVNIADVARAAAA